MSTAIDVNTPTNNILDNRPTMIKLAQEVFGRAQPSVVRAFGQFSKQHDLARLIDAKRAGTFDYGAAIYDIGGGTKYPINVAGVMAVLDKSDAGEAITAEDIGAMYTQGPLNEEVLKKSAELLPKIVLKNGATNGVHKPQKTAAPVAEGEVQVNEQKEERKVVEFRKKEPDPAVEEAQDVGPVFEELRTLREGLADAFEAVSNSADANYTVLRAYLDTVLRNQEALNQNLKKLSEFYGEIELNPVETHVTDSPAQRPTPVVKPTKAAKVEQVEEAESTKTPTPTKAMKARAAATETKLPPEAGDTDKAALIAELEITPESLKKLSLEELRKLAEQVGVKEAHKIVFPKVVRRKIHAELGWAAPSE